MPHPADRPNLSQVIIFIFIFSLSSFEPRPVLHAYRSSASRYCTVSLRSFSDRCLGCTHLFFFSLEAASISSTPRREICTLIFVYFVYSITGIYTIYSMQFAPAKTLRLTQVLAKSLSFKNWLSPRFLFPFRKLLHINLLRLQYYMCIYHL